MISGSLTILCRRPLPVPPRRPPALEPLWWLTTAWTWSDWGGPSSMKAERKKEERKRIGRQWNKQRIINCDSISNQSAEMSSMTSGRVLTCSSLLEPFFSFCFLRSSYFFRPSRYSATASLVGFLLSPEETGGTSLLININSSFTLNKP